MITKEIRRGEVFADRYRVIRRLGVGGMATVWLAEDERLGREVAIKRLNTDAPEESLARFRREARIGATLNHPNFVSVFDTIATDEGALIVMEYVPGHSLEELSKAGPMDPERVVDILADAAAALDHAHKQDVVHRDIKPANILVRDDGAVKLADLGIAKAMDATQITAEGKVIGTAPYMAPERFEAAGTGGPSSDVYALAAVAYELLSGVPVDSRPVRNGEPLDRQALAANWPGPPDEVFGVIMRALSAEPSRRPASAGEFVAELDEAVRGGGAPDTLPFIPPSMETSQEPVRRSRPEPPWETRPGLPPSSGRGGSRGSRFGAVLAVLLVAGLGVAGGLALLGSGSGGGDSPKKQAKASRDRAGKSDTADAGTSSADASPTPVVEDQSASSPPPTSSSSLSSGDGAGLNAEGFDLINQGRYSEAVPILRRAVASYPEGSTDLNYAYALYNLGNALRLSGHPDEAIPILERRLEIPNQRSTVAAELERARAEAGTD
jgi:eukaryotic-like serine/threonine-protein kinase